MSIQAAAVAAFRRFRDDPRHPSLRLHDLKETARGRHWPGSRSVSITMTYRAIYCADAGRNVWYWVGTHSDYNTFVGLS